MPHVFNTLHTMVRALDYHLERTNIINSNIAHVDTPGYRPRELVRPPEDDWRHRLAMAVSHPDHIRSARERAAAENTVLEDRTAQPGLDGNSVDLDREAAKQAVNAQQYESVARMMTQHIGMLRYAANDGSQ